MEEMNLHPIVIHFPIALLTLYSIFELIRFQKVIEKPYVFYIKAFLVTFGALGALAGVITGAITSGWAIGGPRIFALHQIFGLSTLILSIGIAKGYLFHWQRPNWYSEHVLRPRVLVPLALLLLIAITITGGLGAAMTRGTHFDPFMAPIFKLLGVY
ncbi:hypothetical protein KW796_01385 [Candidatus Parcubacteria bacterium]|nr:hypothetical protein [Candidatus Parcubacteria bacterium]